MWIASMFVLPLLMLPLMLIVSVMTWPLDLIFREKKPNLHAE
jgi:hypothetical protein